MNTSIGLLLNILGRRILNYRLARRLERERLSVESADFARSIVDALPSHLAIISNSGAVLAVNQAWREFSGNRGSMLARSEVGENYLVACDHAAGKNCPEAAV